jgi:hypothetical protein
MEHAAGYLVRYGLMGHVGRFPFEPAAGGSLRRGQAVVIRTDRGLELGEVLLSPGSSKGTELDLETASPRVLRPASTADLECARRSDALRSERFSTCRQVLDEVGCALDLLDVEPLLDQNTTVLHVIGTVNLDLARLRAGFRSRLNFDVVFEAVGSLPLSSQESEPAGTSTLNGRGRCGDCDCSAGECGRALRRGSVALTDSETILAAADERPSGDCGSVAHSACASCEVQRYRQSRRVSAVP